MARESDQGAAMRRPALALIGCGEEFQLSAHSGTKP